MTEAMKKTWDFYHFKPDAKIVQQEFGFYVLDRWKKEGFLTDDTDLNRLFGFDPPGTFTFWGLGWCEAAFEPFFEEEVLEDRGESELVRDFAGRSVQFFKNRRSGYMPTYVEHPVKDWDSWERNVKWRMDPASPGRYGAAFKQEMQDAVSWQAEGGYICQNIAGGYMYLRSLAGPEDIMYLFYDAPALVHDCMQTWFALADKVLEKRQEQVLLDEIFLAEDICYKHGLLISPVMVREFLFPYYQQLLSNAKARQRDKTKRLRLQIDTDGNCYDAIDLYRSVGMDYLSPFEVASGCDVVEVRKKYPDLLMRGGFDKRILAAGREAIDREIDRIMPFMVKHGGFIPSCDHGVPEEVAFEDYLYYRRQMSEF